MIFYIVYSILKTPASRVFRAISENDWQLLHALNKYEDTFEYKNNEGRNCAFISVIKKNIKMIKFFKNMSDLF